MGLRSSLTFRAQASSTKEEERGLVGVFGFVSPGSHRPLGFSEAEFARLGRSFVAGMCWFLVKSFRRRLCSSTLFTDYPGTVDWASYLGFSIKALSTNGTQQISF